MIKLLPVMTVLGCVGLSPLAQSTSMARALRPLLEESAPVKPLPKWKVARAAAIASKSSGAPVIEAAPVLVSLSAPKSLVLASVVQPAVAPVVVVTASNPVTNVPAVQAAIVPVSLVSVAHSAVIPTIAPTVIPTLTLFPTISPSISPVSPTAIIIYPTTIIIYPTTVISPS